MDESKANELVLGFDAKLMYGFTGLMDEDLGFHGVSDRDSDRRWLNSCLKRSYLMPRGAVEDDSSFKQIIPYVVMRNGSKIFSYCRKGSEERLHDKVSIGIGGHINSVDSPNNLLKAPQAAAKRELREEVEVIGAKASDLLQIHSWFSVPPLVLYDPTDAVGEVHIGVVYILNFSGEVAAKISMQEEGYNTSWKMKDQLKGENLESWSRILIESGRCL